MEGWPAWGRILRPFGLITTQETEWSTGGGALTGLSHPTEHADMPLSSTLSRALRGGGGWSVTGRIHRPFGLKDNPEDGLKALTCAASIYTTP